MIPKIIFTAWFSESGEIPAKVQKCIDSQRLEGYSHMVITLDSIFADHDYVRECIASPHTSVKWAKLADFCKLWYLYHIGGIFLDADIEVLRPFDSLLDNGMVVGLESIDQEKGLVVIGNAVMMAEPGNPVIGEILDNMVGRFRGDDDQCYEAGMDLVNLLSIKHQDKIKIVTPEYFYPYNHITGITNVTDNSICIHHFNKTWVLPTIDFIIPHLGREEGLRKCIESINNLDYPKDLINIVVLGGEETVPIKVNIGVKSTFGEYICYAANDMEFYPDCITKAVEASRKYKKGLVSFNEGFVGPDKGNICTHFIIKRDLLPKIGNMVFNTDIKHVGVDNLLWKQCDTIGEAYWCEEARILHKHFSLGYKLDDIYEKGWANVSEDREKLKNLL